MTHTTGPWKVISGAVYTQDDRPIANMVRNEEASEAGIYPVERDENARLIASAPELLEALRACLKCLNMDSDMQEDFAPEIAQADKAIAYAIKALHLTK